MNQNCWKWVWVVWLCAASFCLGRLTQFDGVRAETDKVGEIYRFGDCVYALGQKKAEVLESFQREFLVSMSQPDIDQPEISLYTVHKREGNKEHIGSLHFDHGVLTRVIRTLGQFESADGGTIVSRLVSALAEMAERSKAPVGVRWGNGVFQGRKIGNTTIELYSGNEVVSAIYFDGPGGAQVVTVTSSISEKSSVQD